MFGPGAVCAARVKLAGAPSHSPPPPAMPTAPDKVEAAVERARKRNEGHRHSTPPGARGGGRRVGDRGGGFWRPARPPRAPTGLKHHEKHRAQEEHGPVLHEHRPDARPPSDAAARASAALGGPPGPPLPPAPEEAE